MDIKKYNEFVASTILGFCVVAVVTFFIIFAVKKCKESEPVQQVCYTISVDSTSVMSPSMKMMADSLMVAIERHDHLISDKYQYILEQRSNVEDYLTFGGIFLTIILSVFGFFGYKSLQGIEDRIKDSVGAEANRKASEKAEAVSNQKFNDYKANTNQDIDRWKSETKDFLNEHLDNKVKGITRQRGFKSAVQEQLEDAYNQKITERLQPIETFAEKLSALESEVEKISIKVNQQNERINLPIRRRRSLVDPLTTSTVDAKVGTSDVEKSASSPM